MGAGSEEEVCKNYMNNTWSCLEEVCGKRSEVGALGRRLCICEMIRLVKEVLDSRLQENSNIVMRFFSAHHSGSRLAPSVTTPLSNDDTTPPVTSGKTPAPPSSPKGPWPRI